MVSSDNGWVVGQSGLILHWNGTEWKRLSSITDSDLFDISFVSKDQGFAAGGRGPLGDKDADWTVIGWNGKQWNRVAFPSKPGGWRVDLLHFTSDQEGCALP